MEWLNFEDVQGLHHLVPIKHIEHIATNDRTTIITYQFDKGLDQKEVRTPNYKNIVDILGANK